MKRQPSYIEIVFTAWLAYCSIYIARLNLSVASVLFEQEGLMDSAQIGIIGSVFSIVYAFGKLSTGNLGDRILPKKTIVVGLLLTGASNILIGMDIGYTGISILWGVNALGQSMLWGPILRVCTEAARKTGHKDLSRLLITSVAFGGVLGLLVASFLADKLGRNACFTVPGVVVLASALLVLLVFPKEKSAGTTSAGAGILASVRTVCSEKSFWVMALPAFSHGMIKDNINVWLTLYCVNNFSMELNSAAGYVFLVPLCALAGRLLYVPLFRILKSDDRVSMVSFLLCIAAVLPLIVNRCSAMAAMVCLGLIAMLVSIINTHMLAVFPVGFSASGNISLVASMMDVLTYGGASVGSLIFGKLIRSRGFVSMFLIWGLMSAAAAAILMCRLHNKRKQSKKESMYS